MLNTLKQTVKRFWKECKSSCTRRKDDYWRELIYSLPAPPVDYEYKTLDTGETIKVEKEVHFVPWGYDGKNGIVQITVK